MNEQTMQVAEIRGQLGGYSVVISGEMCRPFVVAWFNTRSIAEDYKNRWDCEDYQYTVVPGIYLDEKAEVEGGES